MLELLRKIGELADAHGFEVYAVGGCVRDMLMGETTNDLDIVVSKDAPKMARIFAKTYHLNKPVVYERFGTAMVCGLDAKIEFTTARSESYSRDSRKPRVKPAPLLEDLKRRDFTINAIAMTVNQDNFGEIIDPFQGQKDLRAKLIRTPLDPDLTFDDDPLRMLRAVRFFAQFNFRLEEKAKEAIQKHCHRLNEIVSKERIRDELTKILTSKCPSMSVRLLDGVGLLKEILPEIKAMQGMEQNGRYRHKDLYEHTLMVLEGMAPLSQDLSLRWAALLHDVGKPKTRRIYLEKGYTFYGHDLLGAKLTYHILKRLKYDNAQIDRVVGLVKHHMRLSLLDENVTDRALRRLIREIGPFLDDLFLLAKADRTGYRITSMADLEILSQRIESLGKEEIKALRPPIDGYEVMRLLGIGPGPRVGKALNALLEAVIDQRIEPSPEAARKFILENFASTPSSSLTKLFEPEGQLRVDCQ